MSSVAMTALSDSSPHSSQPDQPDQPSADLASVLWWDRSPLGRCVVAIGCGVIAFMGFSTYQSFRQPPEPASESAVEVAATGSAAVAPFDAGLQDPKATQASVPGGQVARPATDPWDNLTVDQWRAVLMGTLERHGDTFGLLLYAIDEIESIDVFGFDLKTDTVVVHLRLYGNDQAVTSDVAWRAGMAVGLLWNPEAKQWNPSVWEGPSAEFVVSGATYRCSSEVMTQMGQFLLARSQWERQCRIS